MTKDDIIRMARAAGFNHPRLETETDYYQLERFATLVADAEAKRIHDEGMVTVGHMREQIAAEREACAVIAETPIGGEQDDITMQAKDRVAAAIRARGQA
jgi:tetraacyldisaccharide-1-P 4'-kinase